MKTRGPNSRRGKPGPAAVKLEACVGWLGDRLASGPVSLTEVRRDAALAGFSAKTLYRAKENLGVGDDPRDGRKWWSLSPIQRGAPGVALDPVAPGSVVAGLTASRKSEPAQRPADGGKPPAPDLTEPARPPSPLSANFALSGQATSRNGDASSQDDAGASSVSTPEPAQPTCRAGGGAASIGGRWARSIREDRAGAPEDDPDSLRQPGDGRPLIVCRGESDRLLLAEQLGDFADVMAVGDGTGESGREAIRAAGLASSVYLAHDADDAGDHAASPWPSSAIRVRSPEKDWRGTHEKHPGMIGYVWGRYLPLGSPPLPKDFFDPTLYAVPPDDHDVAEARAERRDIQEADGIFDGPEPNTGPAEWLAELNRLMDRENPPDLLGAFEEREAIQATRNESAAFDPLGPPLPQRGFQPKADDEAARLLLVAEGWPEAKPESADRLAGAAGFARVDLADLNQLAEFAPPLARPAPVVTMPERPRPKRRAGRVAGPSLF